MSLGHSENRGGVTMRRWICRDCAERANLAYPTGEDGRRYVESYIADGLWLCEGCGAATGKGKDGAFVCGPCRDARRKGYDDRHAYSKARSEETLGIVSHYFEAGDR
jgi:hypothetical protein